MHARTSFTKSTSKVFAAIVATLTLLISVVFAQAPAQAISLATGTASISGTATLDGVTAADNVTVSLLDSTGSVIVATDTDVDGNYSFDDIAAGSYGLQFDSKVSGYLSVFSGGVSNFNDATLINVLDGDLSTGNDYVLPKSASISGLVLGSAVPNKLPQENVAVDVFDANGTQLQQFSVLTDAAGKFTIDGLPAGEYHISFTPDANSVYLPEFYSRAASFDTSTAITVTAGQVVTNINTVLVKPASVSGVAFAASLTGGSPTVAPDVTVELLNLVGDTVASTTTDIDGTYTFNPVTPDEYRVRFTPSLDDADHSTTYYAGKSSFESSTPLIVGAGAQLTNVNGVLPGWASISGVVKGGATAGTARVLVNATVEAFDESGNSLGSTTTDASGKYTLGQIPAGLVRVAFTPSEDTDAAFVSEFWNHKRSLDTATAINVASGQAVTGISPLLPLWSKISGTVKGYVTSTSSTALSNATVEAFDETGNSVGSTTTDANGAYTIENLLAGSYRLQFTPDPDTGAAWAPEYSGHKYQLEKATALTVSASSTLKGQDIVLPKWSSLAGVVTGANNVPLPSTDVTLFDQNGYSIATVATDETGAYKFENLTAGNYTLYFLPSNADYADQYWGGTHTIDTASAITLASSRDLTGQNVKLVKFAKITGTLLGFDGTNTAPLSGQSLYIYDSTGNYVANAWTDADGNWSAENLYADTYRIYADGGESGYLGEWYNGKSSLASATAVAVAEGVTVATSTITLRLGGSVSGTVTSSADGTPLSYVTVNVYTTTGNLAGSATSDDNGNYVVNGLTTGKYLVYFQPADNHIARYYGDGDGLVGAEVDVAELATTENINASLDIGATISGTVTGAGSGIESVAVTAYAPDGSIQGTAYTDVNGEYSVDGLRAGSYTLRFTPTDNFVAVWWNGETDRANAEYFEVEAATDVTGKDIELVEGATISGNLTGLSSDDESPLADATVELYLEDGTFVTSTQSDENGDYSFIGLVAGSYTVHFIPSGNYIPTWWDSAKNQDVADIIDLSTGEDALNIDAALNSGASISGTVWGDGSVVDVVAKNALVEAYNESGDLVRSTRSDDSGAYTLDGLAAGSYRLHFVPNGNYVEAWSGNQDFLATATPIVVSEGATLTGQDIVLAKGLSISGNLALTGETNDLSGISVEVYDENGQQVKSVTTDDNGDYTVIGLKPGSYEVFFNASGKNFVSEWYSNATSMETSRPVTVSATGGLVNLTETLAAGAALTGTVNDSNGAVGGVRVHIFNSAGTEVATDITDNSGVFLVNGLPAGSYRLHYEGQYQNLVSVYSGGGRTLDAAAVVNVTAGAVAAASNAPVVLLTGCKISGKVTGDGASLQGVLVRSLNRARTFAPSAVTDADGNYTIQGLAPGIYTLKFEPSAADNFVAEFSGGSATEANATAITVAFGSDSAGNDADLEVGATISGVITTSGTGAPIAGINVIATNSAGTTSLAGAYTDRSGVYQIVGLPAGSYKLRLVSYTQPLSNLNFISGWYATASTVATASSATAITIAAKANVSGKNASLDAAFSISGRVKGYSASYNLRQANATVKIYSATSGSVVLTTQTDAMGNYTAVLPGTGTYKVEFVGTTGFAGEFNRDKPTLVAADSITAAPGTAVNEVNAVLASATNALKFSSTPVPTVTGTALVGRELTVTTGNWDAGAELFIQWLRNGAAIEGENDSVYLLTADDAGASITVSVTGSKDGYIAATKASAATVLAKPSITKFTPTSSAPRTTVTITGKNFNGITAVKFNGLDAVKFTVVSSTKITATFAGPSATASIQVIGANGVGSSSKKYSLKVPKPTLKLFKGTSGSVGDEITITGTNLLDTIGVKFGSVLSTEITIVSSKTIRVVIPDGAVSGKLTLVSYGGTAKSTKSFRVR